MAGKPPALIVGVGAATGQSVCRRLQGGYRLAMVARSAELIGGLADSLSDARPYQCDVTDRDRWAATLQDMRAEIGVPSRILINTEGGAWGSYSEIPLEKFAHGFSVNVVSFLQLVQTLYGDRDSIAADTRIVISSSPAAYGADPRFLGIGASRNAQRALAETLHAILAPAGLSFCLLNIDGAIDEPAMRGAYPEAGDDFFIRPDAIAALVADLFATPDFPTIARIDNGVHGLR